MKHWLEVLSFFAVRRSKDHLPLALALASDIVCGRFNISKCCCNAQTRPGYEWTYGGDRAMGELCLFSQRSQCQLSPGIEREGMVGVDALRFVVVVVRKVRSQSFTSSVCHDTGAWHGIVDTPEQPPVEITSFLGSLLPMPS
jgi:hypothetical protein